MIVILGAAHPAAHPMPPTDLTALPLWELADRLRRREVGPVEVTDAVLGRVERLEPRLHAYIRVTADAARAAAREAEREIAAGRYRGPLHGVPVGIKDLCDTAGVPTTAGTRIFAERVPARDATVVRKLRAAGAVIVGKLNLHEIAFGVTGINPHFGTVHNPWDPDRITGGSSSGSGAAVAAGECFAALGSDTGGSIRMPSSLCGVVGLKPTHGRVSAHGVVPLAWSLDHVGPMARCVRDVALVLGAIAGHDPLDPWSADVAVEDWAAELETGVRGLRVGVPTAYAFEECAAEVVAAVEGAIATLEALGARRVEVDTRALAPWWIANAAILLGEAAACWAEEFQRQPEAFGADVRERLALAVDVRAFQYASAARLRDELRRGAADAALFAAADVLLMPATPVAAPTIAEAAATDLAGVLARNTAPFDLTGQPALAMPCGRTAGGLPIGVQIVGRRWEERTVLRAAHAYEQARGPLPGPVELDGAGGGRPGQNPAYPGGRQPFS